MPTVSVGDFRIGISFDDKDCFIIFQNRCSRMRMKRPKLGGKSDLLLWAEPGLVAKKKVQRVPIEPVLVP